MDYPQTWTKHNIYKCIYSNTLADDILYTLLKVTFDNCFVGKESYLNYLLGNMWRNYNETFRDLCITWLNISYYFSTGDPNTYNRYTLVEKYPNSMEDLLLMILNRTESAMIKVYHPEVDAAPKNYQVRNIPNVFNATVEDILFEILNELRRVQEQEALTRAGLVQSCSFTREDILLQILNTIMPLVVIPYEPDFDNNCRGQFNFLDTQYITKDASNYVSLARDERNKPYQWGAEVETNGTALVDANADGLADLYSKNTGNVGTFITDGTSGWGMTRAQKLRGNYNYSWMRLTTSPANGNVFWHRAKYRATNSFSLGRTLYSLNTSNPITVENITMYPGECYNADYSQNGYIEVASKTCQEIIFPKYVISENQTNAKPIYIAGGYGLAFMTNSRSASVHCPTGTKLYFVAIRNGVDTQPKVYDDYTLFGNMNTNYFAIAGNASRKFYLLALLLRPTTDSMDIQNKTKEWLRKKYNAL